MSGRNGKHQPKPPPKTVTVIAVPVEAIVEDAIKWALENGLSMPLQAQAKEEDFGYIVDVDELSGKKRMAKARFTRAGKRTLYERAR